MNQINMQGKYVAFNNVADCPVESETASIASKVLADILNKILLRYVDRLMEVELNHQNE